MYEEYYGRTIQTEYVFPPIPNRNWDWYATFDDYDGAPDSNSLMGHGPSRKAAIEDLLEQARERGMI